LPIGEREPRPEKVQAVAEIKELLESSTLVLTDYKGLDVKAISDLRAKLREAGSGYKVVKNNLLKLAAKETPAAELTEGLQGPTAILFTSDDPVAAAKVLDEFGKADKPVSVRSGIVDGQIMAPEQLSALAKIPPKQQLYAMVVGGLQGPITGLIGTLNQLTVQLVMTLQAVAKEKEAAA